MKRLFFSLAMLCLCIMQAKAQVSSVPLPASPRQQLLNKYAPLDKAQVPGGFLFNLTMPQVAPTLFFGRQTDTTQMAPDAYLMLYNEFRSCYTGNANPLVPVTNTLAQQVTETSDDTVKLSFMAIRFGMLRDDALSSNLIQEINGQYHDVSGRLTSPYLDLPCMSVSALTKVVTTLQPVFTLPQALQFSNINMPGTVWQLDANDGQGFRPLMLDGSCGANYALGGLKRITLKANYQNHDYYMYTQVLVEPIAQTSSLSGGGGVYSDNPDLTIYLTSDKSFQGPDETSPSANSVEVNIFYACADRQLRKPIIFVGGYEKAVLNPNLDNDWRALIDERIRKEFDAPDPLHHLAGGELTMERTLYEAGYDLIYVDWANGAVIPGTTPGITLPGLPNGDDYIQRNAYAIEKMLLEINKLKQASGSTEENILIGGSMGGLVCKYALLDMQSRNEKHEVRTFISFDSPLTGANIPLGTQALVQLMGHITYDLLDYPICVPGTSLCTPQLPSIVAAGLDAFNRPGVRQMVIQRVWRNGTNLNFGRSPEYTALMAEIAAFGPLNVEHIAVTNGANPNVLLENEVGPGGLLTDYSMSASANANAGVTLVTPFGNINIGVSATMSTSTSIKIRAEGNYTPVNALEFSFVLSGVPPLNFVLTTTGTELPLSTISGGNSKLGIIQNLAPSSILNMSLVPPGVYPIPLASASPSGTTGTTGGFGLGSFAGYSASATLAVNAPLALHCTFIPTFSALQMPLPTASYVPGTTLGCGATRCSSPIDLGTIVNNTGGIVSRNWVNPNNAQPEVNQNHVFLDNRIANILLELADPSITNPGLKLPTNLSTYFNAALVTQKQIGGVTILAGGKLSINNSGNAGSGIGSNQPQAIINPYTAIVTGCSGVVLTVNKNGKLFIGSDDQQRTGHVIVQSGSTVHIQRGGNLTALGKNSSLSVQVGGTLIIDEMAEIDLQPLTSKIRIDGTLRINGNFDFFGDGYFEFGPEAILEYGSGVQEWKLVGRGKGKRFMRLEGDLIVPDQKVLFLKDGLVEHVGITAGRIMLPAPTNPSDPTLMRRGYKGLSVTHVCLGSQSAINAEWTRDIELADCDFNAGTISFGIAIECLNVPMLRVQQCNFKENLVDIRDNSYSSYADISLSTFTGGTWGLIMENVQKIQLAGCHFTGYKTMAHNSIDLNYEESVAAVTISNSMLCDVRDCIFQDCNVGISNPQYNPWFETLNGDGRPSILNVYGTTFARGGAGIYMMGNKFGGAVLSRCSNYSFNEVAITGSDIKLGIDMGSSGGAKPSNFFQMFSSPSKRYIDICYPSLASAGLVGAQMMRGNMWSYGNQGDSQPELRIRLSDKSCSNPSAIAVTAPFARFSDRSKDCGEPYFVINNDPEVQCTTDEGWFLNHTYTNLMYHYTTTWIEGMPTVNLVTLAQPFEQLAGLYHHYTSNLYPASCKQYVAISRAIVEAANGNTEFLQSSNSAPRQNQKPDDFTMSPNPSDGEVLITLPNSSHEVRVTDLNGKMVFTGSASEYLLVTTSSWQSGVYLVTMFATDGSTRPVTKKLIVQKL
jgi:pimeloyl-ACP methyl ester carboxylesterase